MAQKHTKSGIPHEDRTATEPREDALHDVILDRISDVNESVKLYKLKIKNAQNGVKFRPGQWLDVFIPSMPKAGGFTLTSTPSQALPATVTERKKTASAPFLELAVQQSSDNPPAAWLWRKPKDILGSELKVRVGGSFTWPPHGWSATQIEHIEKVIFVAGGVGINPLISMLTSMFETSATVPAPVDVRFLYSTKLPASANGSDILFLPRLREFAEARPGSMDLTLHLTNVAAKTKLENPESLGWYVDRRIEKRDLETALGEDVQHRKKTLIYVCGPPRMTDDIVAWFGRQEGVKTDMVLCEKWCIIEGIKETKGSILFRPRSNKKDVQ